MVRWTNSVRTKIETCSDPQMKLDLESAAKKLQIMESAISLHRTWVLRSGCQEKAWAGFDSQWRIMMRFAASEPQQSFMCEFLWDLRLQILAELRAKVFSHAALGQRGTQDQVLF